MECDNSQYEIFEFSFFTVVGGTIFLFGITGNIISFLVFNKYSSKSSLTLLLLSLAVFDSIFLAVAIIFYSIHPTMDQMGLTIEYEPIKAYLLYYFIPFNYMIRLCVVWITVLIACNRFIVVCKPLHAASLCTMSRARKHLAILVVVSVAYNLVKYGELEVRKAHSSGHNRTVTYAHPTTLGDNWWYNLIYRNVLYMLIYYVIPLIILIAINIRLVFTLRTAASERAEMSNVQEARDKGLTLVSVIIISVFVLCQTPPMINQFLHNFLTYTYQECGRVQFYVEDVCSMLVFLNSAVNVLIYTLFCRQFRRRLFRLLHITPQTDIRSTTETDAPPQADQKTSCCNLS